MSFFPLEKSMNEWRSAERKSKKQSFSVARENEKMQDTAADVSYSIVTSNASLNKDATKVRDLVCVGRMRL